MGKAERKASKKHNKTLSSSLKKKSLINSTNKDEETPPALTTHPPTPPPRKPSLKQSSAVTVVEKKSSSKMKMKPSLAAALLSLPWPQPDNIQRALAKRREEEATKKIEDEIESIKSQLDKRDENDNATCCGKSSCCCGTAKGKGPLKGRSSRKLCYMKNKSKCSVDPRQSTSKPETPVIKGNPERKPGEPYRPVTIPDFDHVHTAWPGFDHAPTPNWKQKYMIAKPWPASSYQQQQHPHSSGRVKFNEKSLQQQNHFHPESLLLTRPSAQIDLRNRNNFSGRSFASIRSPSSSTAMLIHVNKMAGGRSGSEEDVAGREIALPQKQSIRVDRVGSSIK